MFSNRFLNAQVGLQLRAFDGLAHADDDAVIERRRTRRTAIGAGLAGAMLAPAGAFAAPATANCGVEEASGLVAIIRRAATFLMVLGGAVFLLMMVTAGFLIMGGAANKKYVKLGMSIAKNAFIGLIILVLAWFFRSVVLQFLGGATGNQAATNCPSDGGGVPGAGGQ